MVTFVCEYCDKTLKKKQCEGHIRACSPGSLICIDCGNVYHGLAFKGHISCISQQQKHWGQYAKPKKTKQIQKQDKQKKQQDKPKLRKPSKQLSGSNNEEKVEEQEWKGWKNELKALVKQSQGKIEKNKLIELSKKKYQDIVGGEIPENQFIQNKIKKMTKLEQVTYVFYKNQ